MLKKGKWLRQWKSLMLKETDFAVDMIDEMVETAILDYNDELSPNESVKNIRETQDEVTEDLMTGVLC